MAVAAPTITITITTLVVHPHVIGVEADRRSRDVEVAEDEDAIAAVLGATRDRDPRQNGEDPADAVDRLHHAGVLVDALGASVDPEADHHHNA